MRSLLLFLSLLVSGPAYAQLYYDIAFPALAFTDPVDLEYATDGSNRLYVVEKQGVIRGFVNDPAVTIAPVFLDIAKQVDSGGEGGLLGLAFHPNYADNGFFFVNYTTGGPLRSRVSRFSRSAADPDQADPTSEVILLEIPQPFPNHNGGDLAFGPDGYLYTSFGDGGSGGDPEGNGQDATTLLGALLRLDVDGGGAASDCGGPDANYTVPPNALADGPGGACDEIFAYGLRNPWRFSFDRATGDLWAGDVGEASWEEVNLLIDGGNYGWNTKEGPDCFPPSAPPACNDTGLIAPVWYYPRSVGQSVTGGFVYRGDAVPELEDRYVYADFTGGKLFALAYDPASGEVDNVQLNEGGETFSGVASFGEDPDGELYMTLFNFQTPSEGRVYRFYSDTDTDSSGGTPGDAAALEVYPNPTLGTVHVRVLTTLSGPVHITVYDGLGREVAVVWDGPALPESRALPLNVAGLAAGIYTLRMDVGGTTHAQKFTITR